MSFLKAEWRKLAIANFVVDPEILTAYLPTGTELDFWEGKCYISLVGFLFKNTKLLGAKIPYHVNFEEVNLRFYVKRRVNGEWRRGVVFIKEIVPKPALAIIANTIYKENYESMPMTHSWTEDLHSRSVEYKWKRDSKWQGFMVKAEKLSSEIRQGTEAQFITEHYWGYAQINHKKSNEYEVTHPQWETYRVIDFKISVDFALTYGEQFRFINALKPSSVMLAEGSEITVEHKSSIRP